METTGTGTATGTYTGGTGGSGQTSQTFTVDEAAFVSVCDWSGYAWTGADSNSTVEPESLDATPAGASLCIEGTVGGRSFRVGNATLGINLNQGVGSSSSNPDQAPGHDGVYVDLTIQGDTNTQIQIQSSGGDESWCVSYTGPKAYYWSDFNTGCEDNDSGDYYEGEPINALLIKVVGGRADIDYDVCLNGLECHDDSGGTGGAPGSGGGPGSGGDTGTGGGPGAGGVPGTGGAGATVVTKGFVGNITTWDSVDTDGQSFVKHWDQITPENAGKWGSVERGNDNYDWGTLDAIYDYAQDNGITFKQHAFVWGSQQPNFSIGEEDVKDWMTRFCERYPNTGLIDVVNEPPPHTTPAYVNSIGGGTNGDWAWVVNSFNWAREACPNAVLILNDYNNIEWSNDNSHFIRIVQALQDQAAPIDAVGAQAHDMDVVSFSTVKTLLAKLHEETGLPVYITEYDPSTSDDNRQLQWYQEQIPYFREQEYIHGITIWGWIYGKTWNAAPQSGLIRNGSPRPAMTWLMEELGRPVP